MRLWVRLALAMALVALVPMVAVGVQAARTAGDSAEALSADGLRREALLHAEVLGRSVSEQRAHAEAWNQVFPGELETLADELRAGFLAAVYRGTPSAVTVVLVDGDGLPVVEPVFAVSGGDRVASTPQRAEALIRRLPITEAMGQGSAVGEPWLPGGLGTTPSMPIAVLAAGPSAAGDVLVLGLEVQLTATDDMAVESVTQHGVSLFDSSGNVLVGDGHPLLRADLLRALLGTDSDFQYGEGEGEVLGSMVRVPKTRWSVAVFEPRSLVRAPAREIQGNLWPLMALAALVAVGVAVGIAGTLSRPVEQLRDATLALAEGARGQRTDMARSDELGELARAFDHMSTRLDQNQEEIDAQQQEIEAFNRELQDRVAERTQQLEEAQVELVRSGQLAAVAQVGAGLAHELNNPLAAVLGLSQVLKMRYPDESLLADLEGEAARCRTVVGDLLRFTSGEVDPERAPVVDLREVLDEVVRLVGGAFKQRGVALELVKPDSRSALAVRVDRVAGSRILAQVLHAMRAGLEPGAAVRVAGVLAEGQVEVTIQSDKPLSANTSRRDDWMASGFDLWVARQLLAQLQGRLDEHNDDHGASWVLTLPGRGVRRLMVSLLALVVVVAMVTAVWRYAAVDRVEAELRIIEVEGAVSLGDGAASRLVGAGEQLKADDHVSTAEGSRAVLALNGDSRIRLGAASSVRVKSIDLDGVALELEDGALTATVRPESGAVRVGNGGREVVATRGEFAVGVSGDVMQVDAREGALVLSGVDVTRVEEGQQATVVDRHAEIAQVPQELLLSVTWPDAVRTRLADTLVEGDTAPGAKVVARGSFGARTTRAGRDGRFRLKVPLEEGENTVRLEAIDPVGRSTEVTGALQTRDTTGPTMKGGVEYGP